MVNHELPVIMHLLNDRQVLMGEIHKNSVFDSLWSSYMWHVLNYW